MGMVAALGSLGMGAYGMMNNPASKVQTPQMFQMPNMGGASNNVFGTIGGLGKYNLSDPNLATDITRGMVHNPYAGGFQQGSNFAGGLGQLGALNQFGTGGGLTNFGMNTLPAWAGSIANASMDPQQALYQRTLQQVQDQSGAQNAMAGVGTTPYGAGLTNQATSDFNINWQNNQLNRMIAGGGAAGGLMSQGGQLAQLGQGMQQQAPLSYLNASGIPYGTFAGIGGAQMGALSGLQQYGVGGTQIPGQQIQDYLAYLGQGTGATNAATGVGQLGLNQANLGFNQNLMSASMLGGGLGGLGARGYGIPGFGQSTGWGPTWSNMGNPSGTGGLY